MIIGQIAFVCTAHEASLHESLAAAVHVKRYAERYDEWESWPRVTPGGKCRIHAKLRRWPASC